MFASFFLNYSSVSKLKFHALFHIYFFFLFFTAHLNFALLLSDACIAQEFLEILWRIRDSKNIKIPYYIGISRQVILNPCFFFFFCIKLILLQFITIENTIIHVNFRTLYYLWICIAIFISTKREIFCLLLPVILFIHKMKLKLN